MGAVAAVHQRKALTNGLGGLGFGAAPLGNLFAPLTDDAAAATLAQAWAHGVRYFDTAPHYGNGLSEHRVGHFLRTQPRGDYTLSTKVGRLLTADAHAATVQNSYHGVLPFAPRFDYTASGARRSLEDSLQRLGLARIDIVYVHDIDHRTHGDALAARYREAVEGALPALAQLREEGVIGAIGLGVNEWEVCRDVLRDSDVDILLLAGRYTLLDHSALAELLPICEQRGVRVVIGGPYNSGILATGAVAGAYYDYGPAPEPILARVRELAAVCECFDVPLRAAALQFPMAHPSVVAVIPGARAPAEVNDAARMMNTVIPPAFWAALVAAGLVPGIAPLPT